MHEGAPISLEHIMAVILYTDFTQLSSDFTATFRRKNPFEHEEQVEKRNNKYWWWSRHLAEVLKNYGENYIDDELIGPLFTGTSWVMTLPSFNIHLHSPTSTSVQISVALKFGGASGMILEFDNNTASAVYTQGFDCPGSHALEKKMKGVLRLIYLLAMLIS